MWYFYADFNLKYRFCTFDYHNYYTILMIKYLLYYLTYGYDNDGLRRLNYKKTCLDWYYTLTFAFEIWYQHGYINILIYL